MIICQVHTPVLLSMRLGVVGLAAATQRDPSHPLLTPTYPSSVFSLVAFYFTQYFPPTPADMPRVTASSSTAVAAEVLLKCGSIHPLGPSSSSSSFLRLHRGEVTAARPGATWASPLQTARRGISQQASDWICQLRYGSGDAPYFGAGGSAFSAEALETRRLYTKALLYASGGGRLARDWIGGSTALGTPNQTLLFIALQYTASEEDAVRLREHMVGKILDAEMAAGGGAGTNPDDGNESSWAKAHTEDAAAVRAAEDLLLRHAPAVRCFMYDAVSASLFHCHNDVSVMAAAKKHTFEVGQRHFGMTPEDMAQTWGLVEAELLLHGEKVKVLGQPWGEAA